MSRVVAAVAVSLLLGATGVGAQLAQRVAALDEGSIRFSYPVRPDVEICPQGVRIGERQAWWRHGGRDASFEACHSGPAEVEVRVRGGTVRDVDLIRTAEERSDDAIDFGGVDAGEATRFLLSLAYTGASGQASEDAILPAILADAEDPWSPLLALARDRAVHEGVRKGALFWLGQGAADAATLGLAEVAVDEEEDQGIRDAAIFALSQRPTDEAVPLLIEVARTGGEAETRRTAMFWLAQSDDERVVRFFEDVLLGRNR